MTGWWPAVLAGLLVGRLVWLAWRDRADFARAHDAFPCRVRVRSASLEGFSSRWSRTPAHARWVHDVLLVRQGLLRPRIHLLPARVAEGELVELDRHRVRGLGPAPVSVRVLLDDEVAIEIAAQGDDHDLLPGPFVVLSVSRLR